MAKDDKKETPESVLGRIGFSGWMLLSVGLIMLFLHLCRNQGTFEHLSEWDFYLRGVGKVVLLSEDDVLKRTGAENVTVLSWGEFPEIKAKCPEEDAGALYVALERAGFRLLIVGRDVLGSSAAPVGSALWRLATFRPVEGFHPLMIRSEGAIYELVEPSGFSAETLGKLVKIVRDELSGRGGEIHNGSDGGNNHPGAPDYEVAVQIQGLSPVVINKKNVAAVRRDLFASGRGGSLELAAVEAAREIRKIFNKKLADSEGDMGKAVDRYTIELHVMVDFTLVAHERGEMDSAAYWNYIDSVFYPGLYGVYVNRLAGEEMNYLYTPRSKFRLPSDAVYWMRTSGKKVIERIVRDMHIGSLEEFAGKEKITVDRFRTVHVVEEKPGGKVTAFFRGGPVVEPAAVTKENVLGWSGKAAGWLAASLHTDGRFAVSYLPDRDYETVEKAGDVTFDASRYILASMALQDAAALMGEEKFNGYFERSLPILLSWLKVCPGASLAGHCEPALKKRQLLDVCGPMHRSGKAAEVETWGQGGKDRKEISDDLVFVFANTRAGIRETALLGLLVAREISRWDGEERKERETKYLPLLEGIAKFILFMQREDGSFQSYFVSEKNAYYRADDPWGGFASILFLSRAGEIMEEPGVRAALSSALPYYMKMLETKVGRLKSGAAPGKNEEKKLPGTLAWGLMCLAGAGQSSGEGGIGQRLVKAALDISQLLQLDPEKYEMVEPDCEGGFVLKPYRMPDYRSILMTQGVLCAVDIARGLNMKVEEKMLMKAARAGMRFSLQLQLRQPECTLFVPNPGRTDGGIRQSLLISRQRVDFAAHFIGACKKYLDVM